MASAKMVKDASPRSSGQKLLAWLRCESELEPELYRYHARRLTGVVYRVLGNDPELHDLVQEAFLRALSSLRKFRGGAESLDAWLSRIAVYTAHAQIRRHRVRRRRLLSLEDCDAASHPPAVVTTPAQIDALRRTYRVFASLPANQRIPLALHLIDDKTLSEVAAVCGLSQSTAKRRIQRGKQRFEKLAMCDPVLRDWVSGAES